LTQSDIAGVHSSLRGLTPFHCTAFFILRRNVSAQCLFPDIEPMRMRCVDVRRHLSDQQQEARADYRLLRHLLTEEVQRNFKEEQRPLTPTMSDLMRQLDDASRKSRNTQKESH